MARLIDSSVFVAMERRDEPLSVLERFIQFDEFAIASITASELLVGVLRAHSPVRRLRRLQYVESVLNQVPVVSFDLRAARVHAQLLVDLAASGQPIGPNDLMIASTALAHGYGVLTHNLRHFERVPGLNVLSAEE